MSVHWLTRRGICPIGIDFCASGAKLIQLRRRGGRFQLMASARVDLPNVSEVESYRSSRIEQLAEGIRRTIDSARFVGSECSISVDDRLLRVRSVRQPSMPIDDLHRALRLESSTRLGFSDQEPSEIGWLIAGEVTQGEARGEEVILVGARREPLERLVTGLIQVGLRPTAVEPGFVSCARSFTRYIRRSSEQADVRAVVDIGLMSTGVMLLRGGKVAFYKPLDIGGHQLTAAAAERLGLEFETVRDLRRQAMACATGGGEGEGESETMDPKVDRAMFEAVRPLISELAREVSLCMRYYSVTFRGSRPRVCLVVGGEASTPHLIDVLREELRMPTQLGEPLKHVQTHGGVAWQPSVGAGGQWSVAAGLTLRQWELATDRRRAPGGKNAPWMRRSDGVMPRQDESERRAA